MVTFDFSPFYRSTIGFDRMARLLENSARLTDIDNGFPPFNIEASGEDRYRVTLAVAGFSLDELDVAVQENALRISGQKREETEGVQYLHRGIAGRSFDKTFRLADHVKVDSAWLDNGLLTIDLVREVPEEMKPRSIAINAGAPQGVVSRAKKLLGNEKHAA